MFLCIPSSVTSVNMTQLLAEVTLEGIHKNILHWRLELVSAVLPGASLSLADVKPIGGPITTTSEPLPLDKRFQQHYRMAVMRLPIASHTARHPAQNVTGQLRHAYPGQDQKPTIVDDPAQVGLAFVGCPANERISGLGFPSRRAKQGTGQITTLTILHQIAQIFSYRAAVGQVVIPRQIRVELHRLPLAGAEHVPLKRPQLRHGLLDLWGSGRGQSGQARRKSRTSAPLAGWQLNPTSPFELVEEGACRHVFDLAGSIVPVPLSA